MNNIDENGYIIEPEELNQEYESSQFLMITYDILVDKRLSNFQKLLFASITGLCKQKGYCWASNAYFQKLFNRSQTQVSEGISKLVEYGYLKREIVYKKKEDKDGKIITTKQISFRKLFVVINKADWNTGIPENQNRDIPENQKQIDNPLIDNPTSNNSILSKDNKNYIEDNTKTVVNNAGDDNIKNNLEEDKNGIENNKIFSGKADTSASVLKTPAAEGEEKPKKGKGGLGPLYDIITQRMPAAIYPTLNAALKTYLKAHLGIRRLPSPEKWEDMIKKLQEYASVELSGASGKKFMENRALEIVKKAIDGKDGVPYTDFDDIYDKGLMEPTFELNRDYTKGY